MIVKKMSIEAANSIFEQEWDKAEEKYGKVVIGPSKRYKKVTEAFFNLNEAILSQMVTDGHIEPPTQHQRIRCMFDIYHYTFGGVMRPDAEDYSIRVITFLNNQNGLQTNYCH